MPVLLRGMIAGDRMIFSSPPPDFVIYWNHSRNGEVYHKMTRGKVLTVKSLLLLTVGSAVFSAGLNVFIIPHGMFNGGFLGIAQVIEYICVRFFHLELGALPLSGIIYYLINIPLLFMAFKLDRGFFVKTMICVPLYAVLLTVIPIPAAPILHDKLVSCIVGGLLAGVGAGMTLLSGGCGGGEEILGVYFCSKNPNFSVGRMLIILNVFVFGSCLIMTDLETVVYSVLFSVVTSLALDKVHLQNVTLDCVIITKKPNMEKLVIDSIGRGVTYWKGYGGYTGEETNILQTIASKKEALKLRREILKADPDAFIVFNEDVSVTGNYQTRI